MTWKSCYLDHIYSINILVIKTFLSRDKLNDMCCPVKTCHVLKNHN